MADAFHQQVDTGWQHTELVNQPNVLITANRDVTDAEMGSDQTWHVIQSAALNGLINAPRYEHSSGVTRIWLSCKNSASSPRPNLVPEFSWLPCAPWRIDKISLRYPVSDGDSRKIVAVTIAQSYRPLFGTERYAGTGFDPHP